MDGTGNGVLHGILKVCKAGGNFLRTAGRGDSGASRFSWTSLHFLVKLKNLSWAGDNKIKESLKKGVLFV